MSRLLENPFIIYETPPPPWHDLIIIIPISNNLPIDYLPKNVSPHEDLRDSLPLPLLSCDSWMFMKENPDRKKVALLMMFSNIFRSLYVTLTFDRNNQ